MEVLLCHRKRAMVLILPNIRRLRSPESWIIEMGSMRWGESRNDLAVCFLITTYQSPSGG
jgi:hypothetical protein